VGVRVANVLRAGGQRREVGGLGRREKLHIIDEVVPAAMVDRLAGPGGHNDLEGFVEHLAAHPIIDLLTGPRELPGDLVPAQTNAEDEAATSTRT
jgi:hypothetical protein